MGKVNQLFQDQQEADFEAYKLAHPEATEEEVWEAIFQEGPDEPEDIL
jgi:t-SNARE complex subunit (syntaxin)